MSLRHESCSTAETKQHNHRCPTALTMNPGTKTGLQFLSEDSCSVVVINGGVKVM